MLKSRGVLRTVPGIRGAVLVSCCLMSFSASALTFKFNTPGAEHQDVAMSLSAAELAPAAKIVVPVSIQDLTSGAASASKSGASLSSSGAKLKVTQISEPGTLFLAALSGILGFRVLRRRLQN